MLQHAHRLTHRAAAPTDGALRFEKRRLGRTPCDSRVTAYFTDGVERFGVLPLEMLDTSAGGLGGRCARAIEPGMRVMLCPPNIPTAWRSGTVVHCRPDGGQFRVGVAFELRAAA